MNGLKNSHWNKQYKNTNNPPLLDGGLFVDAQQPEKIRRRNHPFMVWAILSAFMLRALASNISL